VENFREPSLKVNDDKKVRIDLNELSKIPKGKMILLTVKCVDMRKAPPKPGEFDRAWYRVINEDTNQTIDYKNIKQIEKPEGFDEDAPVTVEEGEPIPPRVELTYVAGRIFLDETTGRWIYEQLNHTFTSDKYPGIIEKLAEIYRTGEADLQNQKDELERIKHRILEVHEDRRQAAIAAAAKKKAGKKGAKKDDHKEDEEPPREEL